MSETLHRLWLEWHLQTRILAYTYYEFIFKLRISGHSQILLIWPMRVFEFLTIQCSTSTHSKIFSIWPLPYFKPLAFQILNFWPFRDVKPWPSRDFEFLAILQFSTSGFWQLFNFWSFGDFEFLALQNFFLHITPTCVAWNRRLILALRFSEGHLWRYSHTLE